jgi:hypothetical protein
MIILTENKSKRLPKKEAGNNSKWDITWKEALGVFKVLANRKNIAFFEVGPDRNPLGDQEITDFRISGNNLYIYGQQTGYIIFGNRVTRVVREHSTSLNSELLTVLLGPYKELLFSWTS